MASTQMKCPVCIMEEDFVESSAELGSAAVVSVTEPLFGQIYCCLEADSAFSQSLALCS